MPKNLLETKRLILREITIDDAGFMQRLMNDPSWLRFIGDRNIDSIKASEDYISNKIRPSYAKFGFGFYLASLKENDVPIGICGLIKRSTLEHVDVGFAFMPEFRSKGYGYESASAILDYGKDVLKINYIVAITELDNIHSVKLLEKLGLKFEKIIQLGGDEKECRLFVPNNSSF
jgi:RimJ/RimL family protein N-acetyltransferase